MKFFQNCATVAEVKALYRKLAIENHPDHGGSTQLMIEINLEYELALESMDGQTSKGSDGKEHVYKYDQEKENAIMDKINEILSEKMQGVNIDLIGVWIWLSGETKKYKENLKKLGCKWHRVRKVWFFNCSERKSWQSKGSLEDLASQYGKVSFFSEKERQLTA